MLYIFCIEITQLSCDKIAITKQPLPLWSTCATMMTAKQRNAFSYVPAQSTLFSLCYIFYFKSRISLSSTRLPTLKPKKKPNSSSLLYFFFKIVTASSSCLGNQSQPKKRFANCSSAYLHQQVQFPVILLP